MIYIVVEEASILSDLGIPPTQIVSSASGLLKLNSGVGFDVVVAESSEGFSEELIAPLGRLIQLGNKSVLGIGQRRNLTITSVDLESVACTKPSIIAT